MPKAELLHEFYDVCKDIEFDEFSELILNARSREEADFIRTVTDFILQQKQHRVVAEKRF